MNRQKAVFIVSLLILGVIIALPALSPSGDEGGVEGRGCSKVTASLLEKGSESIIELHLFNLEGQDTNYTINVLVDDELCTESILIAPGGLFKYIHHIHSDKLDRREVNVAVYKESELEPIKVVTYVL
jgi:hypothetical protein